MMAGFVFELAMDIAFKIWMRWSRYMPTQLEVVVDDIAMTPDGFDAEALRLEEYKFTWYSMKKWLDPTIRESHFRHWFEATKGYCRALGVRTVRFYIAFAGGDYSWKPGGGPQVRVFDVTYTEEELEDNWDMIRRGYFLVLSEKTAEELVEIEQARKERDAAHA
jgi:hypothetical protein